MIQVSYSKRKLHGKENWTCDVLVSGTDMIVGFGSTKEEAKMKCLDKLAKNYRDALKIVYRDIRALQES